MTAADDSIDDHVNDTLAAGSDLCDEPTVRSVIGSGPKRVDELIEWGMALDRTDDGHLALGREGGHGRSRILHAHGDARA